MRHIGGALGLAAVAVMVGACSGGSPGQTSVPSIAPATDPAAVLRELGPMPDPPAAPIPLVSSVFDDGVTSMDEFLTRVIAANDEFWSLVFARSGLAEPQVNYRWLAPGLSVTTACKAPDGSASRTGDTTASYCPLDDTIYVSTQMAYNVWTGVQTNMPGTTPRFIPADFGTAYMVAHEFAHSIQAELGLVPRGATVKNHELQADCFAGIWAKWAYYNNQLESGDVSEAIEAAEWVGDYQYSEPAHHGTPAERSTAWALGYNTFSPYACEVYDAPG